MAHNLIEAVTRLAQMQEHDRRQLEKMDAEWARMMIFCQKQQDETRKALDDVAAMLGIIEPQTQMPMLPANPGSGPQPSFSAADDVTYARGMGASPGMDMPTGNGEHAG